jgi:ASTRA-associated protein 1
MSVCLEQNRDPASILVAVPSKNLGQVEIFQLPSEARLHIVPASSVIAARPSMTMALRLIHLQDGALALLSADEGGFAHVQVLSLETSAWTTIYSNKAHSQPALGLNLAQSLDCFFTSAADAVVVRHPFPRKASDKLSAEDRKIMRTGHSGQQALEVRDDDKIFGTAGWDSRVRIYSTKTLTELAVLKWHKEACYSMAFAKVFQEQHADLQLLRTSKTENTGDEGSKAHVNEGDDSFVATTEEIVLQSSQSSLTIKQRREQKARNTHWVAAGSKDGKISLWDIF